MALNVGNKVAGAGWMKTGADSAAVAQKAKQEQEIRQQEQGKMFRYFMKENEEARITFIDGALSPEGFLLPPRFYEHNIFLNGKYGNVFVCPERSNPDAGEKCPICESGDYPSLVALFTVIDHRQFTGKNDKVYVNTRKLYVAKSQTFEYLNKQAIKRGGLAGVTFDVSRIGDKSANVGSHLEFVEKHSIQELQALYQEERVDPKTNQKVKGTYFLPADYEKEITYRDSDALRAMGLGKPVVTQSSGVSLPSGTDYQNQL